MNKFIKITLFILITISQYSFAAKKQVQTLPIEIAKIQESVLEAEINESKEINIKNAIIDLSKKLKLEADKSEINKLLKEIDLNMNALSELQTNLNPLRKTQFKWKELDNKYKLAIEFIDSYMKKRESEQAKKNKIIAWIKTNPKEFIIYLIGAAIAIGGTIAGVQYLRSRKQTSTIETETPPSGISQKPEQPQIQPASIATASTPTTLLPEQSEKENEKYIFFRTTEGVFENILNTEITRENDKEVPNVKRAINVANEEYMEHYKNLTPEDVKKVAKNWMHSRIYDDESAEKLKKEYPDPPFPLLTPDDFNRLIEERRDEIERATRETSETIHWVRTRAGKKGQEHG